MYKQKSPYVTPMMVLNPIKIDNIRGKIVKTYPDESKDIINVSFKTFGGTEAVVDGVWTIQDTANIETWYREDITSDTRLKKLNNNRIYEVVGDPENIDDRNQYLKFKVKHIRGSTNG